MDRWREKQDRSLEGLEGATEKKEMQQQDVGEDETSARRERGRERE